MTASVALQKRGIRKKFSSNCPFAAIGFLCHYVLWSFRDQLTRDNQVLALSIEGYEFMMERILLGGTSTLIQNAASPSKNDDNKCDYGISSTPSLHLSELTFSFI